MQFTSAASASGEKNLRIARVLHEQDLLARKLEHVRIEKQTFERVLTTRLTAAEKPAPQEDDP